MIYMAQYGGIVTGITVSGSVQKTTLARVYEEFHAAAEQMHRAGWTAKYSVPSFDRVRAEIEASNGTTTAIGLTTFTKDGTTALLELGSPGKAISPSATDSSDFILNVDFENQALDDSHGDKV